MKRLVFFSIVVLAGCFGAHRDNPAMGDDAGPVCGDVTCDETPAAVCADSDTLRTYSAACTDGACSYPSEDVECGNDGCCTDHCCAAVPSNATDFGSVEATGLVVAPPDGMFDTDVDCVATSALGKCTVVTRTDLPQACVCRADEITIGTLKVKGARALVLLAKKQVIVKTMLDVSGDPAIDGPGGTYRYTGSVDISGGPGGSFATTGAGIQPAAAYGEPSLVPLLGGMAGKKGGRAGGGAGGAVQITAAERVEIQGVINAGGGGGLGGYSTYAISGGGGGGSGGGILVEAPTVDISGAIVANGGGGGGGGGGTVGASYGNTGWGGGEYPTDPMMVAPGGSSDDGHGCPLYGYVYGGDGGYGAIGAMQASAGGSSGYDSRCLDTAFVGGGGGGGGVGRIRINTTTGCQCGGSKIAPQPSFGMLVKQ